MLVSEVMSSPIVAVTPSASIAVAAHLMLDHGFSGLPVIDADGKLKGIVTEGDFLRRAELGTETKRPRWLEYLATGRVAEEYARSHGRKVAEVMQDEPITCRPDDTLEAAVELLVRHHIKRLPVVQGDCVIGIVSRSDLLRALLPLVTEPVTQTAPDWQIAADVEAGLKGETWAGSMIKPTVRTGVVTLDGTVFDGRQEEAARVLAENVPGVKSVVNHLLWIEPTSGTVVGTADVNSP